MTQGDIIYVNGDSFTAGSDLGDYLLPDYPEEHPLADLMSYNFGEKIKNYSTWRQRTFDVASCELKQEVVNTESKHRWSTKLAEITDSNVLNNAYPGSDNFGIFVRTCCDLEKLKSTGHNISAVIIQITGFNRYSYVRNVSTTTGDPFAIDVQNSDKLGLGDGFFLRHVMPIMMNSTRVTSLENEFLKKSLYDEVVYNDQDETSRFVNYLLKIKMFKDAVKGIIGFSPIVLDSLFMYNYIQGYNLANKLTKESYIFSLFSDIFSDQMMSMSLIPENNEKAITGGGHFVSSVHKKFAEQIAMRYFNE